MTKVYTVRDKAAGIFLPPFFVNTELMAIREFNDLLSQNGIIARNPQDFDLYYLCEYDEHTGKMSNDETTTAEPMLVKLGADPKGKSK